LAGVIGDDADGRVVQHLVQEVGIDSALLVIDKLRRTSVKERFLSLAPNQHPHQLLRVDYESNHPIEGLLGAQLTEHILENLPICDALLISDYGKGVCTSTLLRQVILEARRRKIPVIVDPATVPDLSHYHGATILTPNRKEASFAARFSVETPEQAIKAGRVLCRELGLDAVLVTLDRDGIVLVVDNGQAEHFPATVRRVRDITGAGDMVLAMVGLCQAAGITFGDTICMANIAAGLEVERFGVATISRSEIQSEISTKICGLEHKILNVPELTTLVENYRQQRRRIVFTNGCFDLLHAGHIKCLQEAAQQGDVLIVGLNSDTTVSKLKGPGRPIVKQRDRATMLAALECVSHVVVFDDLTPHRMLDALRPDVLVKGGTTNDVVGREFVESYGGVVKVTTHTAGICTTSLVSSIRESACL
jgi:D-beta-D-heptose 7-phosphate kinase/D-beta-D-heptose 1-phosphate adenosyltransferase